MNVIRQHCTRTLFRQFSSSSNKCSYKSAISLDNIYPKSNLSLTTPTKVPADPKCPSFSGYIPIAQDKNNKGRIFCYSF
ncbi:hypothetical protein C0J52_18142 [Blattella germanica]|nr:hypothetical protein C0J52_18142 [Blattella germanica]